MRKSYSPEFKAKLVLDEFRGERMLNGSTSENNVHPNMLTRWKTEASNIIYLLFKMKMLIRANNQKIMKHKLTNFISKSANSPLNMGG